MRDGGFVIARPGAARGARARPVTQLCWAALISAMHMGGCAAAEMICAPKLSVQKTELTDMQPPALVRFWFAVISVDTSVCAARAGHFDVVITRTIEYGPDLTFRERFVWTPPSVTVAIDFSANEAVGAYWLENVTTCSCRVSTDSAPRASSD